jgi:hypothetical protein
MTKSVHPLSLLLPILACSLFTAPAHAQRARVFVASYGNDANPCTFGSPCKTFQQAINVVAGGGEVTAIDSAGFGPINITKAVTITSPDGVEAGIVPAAGSNAIEINAGSSDTVMLRGLTLDGAGAGSDGIVFHSGAALEIVNCVVHDFSDAGIGFSSNSTTSNMSISNTRSFNNANFGILIDFTGGAANVVLDRVEMNYNGVGLEGDAGGATITVSESVAAFNGSGIGAAPGTQGTRIMVRNSTIVSNQQFGLAANAIVGPATIWVTHSTIMGNGTSAAAFSGASIFSYGDNNIDGNGTNNLPFKTPLN